MFNPVFKGDSVQTNATVCSCSCWCSCYCDQFSPTYATFSWEGYQTAGGPGSMFAAWS